MDSAQYGSPTTPVTPPLPIQTVQSTPHCCANHMFGWTKMVGLFAVGVLLMLCWMWISSPMIVTVTGTGEINVPATNATVTFALISGDPTPQGAITSVKAKAATMKQFLTASGIAEGDITTSQVTAVPAALTTAGGTGYRASITMSAKTTNVANVANLVSSLYANGVDAVSQPVLSVENENSLDAQAYMSAMQDAGTKADRIALKNMKVVKKIVLVSNQSSGTTSTATSTSEATQNGVFKITESVSVSYKMW